MDLLSVFKSENQREILISVFPGSIAIWPYICLIVQELNHDFEYFLFEWTLIPIIVIFLLISWGVGFFLSDIASNIEIRLEKIYFSIKATPSKIKTQPPFSALDTFFVLFRLTLGWLLILLNCWETLLGGSVPVRTPEVTRKKLRKEFYVRWNKYLSDCIFDKEPVIIKYYRGVLNRFKFELTIIAAVIIMLIGQLLLFIIEPTNEIDWQMTGIYLSLLIPGTTFLFIEAFKSIELLDNLRGQMITICRQKQTQ